MENAMTEPTTAAGQALLQSLREMAEHQAAGLPFIKPPSAFIASGRDTILAIEAEAEAEAALTPERLADAMAVEGYADPDSVEQWRAPIEAARRILARLEQDR